MSLVSASNLVKGFGSHSVLEDISVRVARGEKIGIVGKNGGGKSTLLKILIGRETPDRGNVHVARGVRIGYLSQISTLEDSRTVREEAREALSSVLDAEQELREAEQFLAQNPHDEEALEAYGSAVDRYEFAGGDEAEKNLFGALTAMGFDERDLDKSVAVLSGGEKTRLSMAKLLASAPDVLALDEPTNHLDIRAVEWLEGFLQRFPGAVLVVSHDRRLLEAVTQTVWEVEARGINIYTGGFNAYREQRAAIRARQLEEYERQQEDIAKTEEFIRRNKAGQNARNAAGRAKQLARLERVDKPVNEPQKMKARIETSGRGGLDVVVCERASKRYDDKILLQNANFTIHRGQRVGIVGPNGTGKTTLVEMIVGEESPDSGYIRTGIGVTVAYHKQEADDFDPDQTVLENFYDRAGMTVGEARGHLARFLFTGDDVYKPVSALSGGERSKLGLALMVLSPANLLILDEPTNHLDVFSCDALTEALGRYPGTLVVVSHDRSLLDSVTNHTLALEGEGVIGYHEGNYSHYRAEKSAKVEKVVTQKQERQERTERETLFAPVASPVPKNGTGKNGVSKTVPIVAASFPPVSAHTQSKERQRAQKRVTVLEAEIEKWETKLAEIETALSAPKSADDALTLSREYEQVQATLAEKFAEWETATIEAEAL